MGLRMSENFPFHAALGSVGMDYSLQLEESYKQYLSKWMSLKRTEGI